MLLYVLLSFTAMALILGLMGLWMGIDAQIEIRAMKKSTHTVQYLGVNSQGLPDIKDDYKDFDSELLDFRKREKKQLHEDMDFFVEENPESSPISDYRSF